jgi:hypothetical protein
MKNITTEKYSPIQPKYDPTLDAYTDVVLFPKKMESAIETIQKYDLPPALKRARKRKKSTVSALQNELLTIFDFDPTEEQLLKLKAFLSQLFADKLKTAQPMQDKMAA